MCAWWGGGGSTAEYIYIILAAKYFQKHKHLNCNLSRCYFNSRNNIPPTPQQNISLVGTVQYLAQKVYASIVCHPLFNPRPGHGNFLRVCDIITHISPLKNIL